MNELDIAKLEEYGRLEGAELGETVELLCALVRRSDYISDGFETALKSEIENQLWYFAHHCKIVTKTEMSKHKYKELEWLE